MRREQAAELAVKTLAGELALPADQIRVEEVAAVEWGDSSLGCPHPDMVYEPAAIAGYRVLLAARGELHAVHVGGGRAVVCRTPPGLSSGGLPQRSSAALRLAAAARRALAARLGVPEARIAVRSVRRVTWPDAGLGCPRPGEAPAPGPVEGFAIELEVDGEHHVYHADLERAVPCPPPAR